MASVLVVDDERSIRATLAEFLREDGHVVRTAETALEAIEHIEADAPDVLVTDIVLPRMSGVELLSRVHQRHPQIQVIMITGEPTVATAVEAVRQGAFDYLSKPISSSAVRSAVERSARVKRLIDDRARLEEENARYREHLEGEIRLRGLALRESEERHRAVVENAVEGILVVQDGVIRFANPSAAALCGYSHDVLVQMKALEIVHPDDREAFRARSAVPASGEGGPSVSTFRFVRAGGGIRWFEARSVVFGWQDRPATLHFLRDVTEEKAERERESRRMQRVELLTRTLLDLAVDPVFNGPDLEAAFRLATETAAERLEIERVSVWLFDEASEHARCVELYERGRATHSPSAAPLLDAHPRYSAALRTERVLAASDALRDSRTSEFASDYLEPLGIGAMLDAGIRRAGSLVGILCCEHVGGTREWTEEQREFVGSLSGLLSIALEADDRRRAEKALERREVEYRSLFEDSPVSLFVEDFSEIMRLFDELRADGVCDLTSYLLEHPAAVEKIVRSIRVIDANDAAVRLHAADSKDDLLARVTREYPPSALAFFRERLSAIWRGERVFETTSDDRTLDGRRLHVALRWSIPPGQEGSLERVLLAKTDITGLVEGERRVRRALDGAIEAIGRVTEARDPYTAGHQRRVTALSVAIAERLGLDDVRVEATRVAGLLHDIGKLSIPAEILTKPSALSALEMSLMKTHPQSAYEVLRTIDFPWPVADIVLQHHERIDGSGYPFGLRGNAILAEARILAVADIVEAMSSHRPYRAALGIGVALDEIEQGRGTLYDAEAVDVCLQLFRTEGFKFPGA